MLALIRLYLSRAVSLTLAAFLFFSTLSPALALAAGSVTVSGTVTNQSGGGVINVSVYATAPGASTTIYGPSTTDSSGAYSLGVDPGTYDIHFDPPSGSGLNSIVQTNFSLSASQTLNVQLTSPPHTLSGTLRDGNGNPVSSLTMVFRLTSTGASTNATTDASGHYSVTLNAGIYYLSQVVGTAPAPIGPVNIVALFGGSGMPQLDLTNNDLLQDFTLPTTTINVTVLDNSGNPVPNATVSIGGNSSDRFPLIGTTPNYFNNASRSAATSSSGLAPLAAFTGTYPAGLICATISGNQVCNTSTLNVSGVTTLTLQQPPQHVFSGTLRDGNGNPVSSLTMVFRLTSTGASTNATTDASGHYSVTLNAGIYYLSQVVGTAPAPIGPVNIVALFGGSGMPQLDVSSTDLSQDFTLPTTTLNVTVKDGFGNPVSGAPVSIGGNSSDRFPLIGTTPNYFNNASRSGSTNSSGGAVLTAFTGTYPAGLICATINGLQTCNNTSLTVSGPTTLLFQAAPQTPPAPTGLTAATPTSSAPVLNWNAVSVAASYNIYRNGVKIGSTTTTSFTDSGLILSGTYSYNVTAVSALNVESSASNTVGVVFSGQGPVVTNVVASPNPVIVGQSATLSASVSDSLYAVTKAEYFEGTDPGEGNGTPMAVISGIASVSLPATLSLGQHTFTVRAENSAGNWTRGTLPTATLTVAQPKLTGRVLNGANIGLANVRVDVVAPTDHTTVLFTTTTDSSGNYTVTVNPGTYDIIYTPADPTYQPTTKTGIDLRVDRTLDVVLVLTPHTFTGTLQDKNGVAIRGATLNFHNQGGQTVNATTAADGSFSATLNPATYSVTLSGTKAASPQAFIPDNFNLSGGSFDLTRDVTQNFVVPAITLSLTTTSSLTNATVGGVTLNLSVTTFTALYPGSATYSGTANYVATTDGAGAASVVILSGSTYAVNAIPPTNAGVVATQFPPAGPLSIDSAADLVMTANIKHFTSHFTDATGTGIAGATLRLSGSLGSFQGTTDVNGDVDVPVAAGTYTLEISGSKPAGSTLHIPDVYSFTGGMVDLTNGDATQDVMLPAAQVRVTAKSSFGSLLPNVDILLTSTPGSVDLYAGGSFAATASSMATTDENGVATLYVTTGLSYVTKATPTSGSGYIVTNLAAGGAVAADTAWDIVLNRDLKHFQGHVYDKNGSPVMGATVKLDGNEADQHYTMTTDNYGYFTHDVAPNANYTLQVTGTAAASPLSYLPDNFSLSATTSITADTAQDVTVSAVNLDILARDDRLTPIANVGIDFTSSGSQNGFAVSSSTIHRTTGTDGHTQLLMLAGTTYTISATPPANIGYINTTFNGTSPITQDVSVVVEFQNHIPLAPTGVAAPGETAAYPTLNWQPVANADHYIVYRNGLQIATVSSTSYTDTTLTQDGTYSYQVSAVSADNYEGAKSTPVSVLYDTTAPTLTDPSFSVNPKQVSQPTDLSVTVADAGSGVRGGEYFIGLTDPGQGNGMAMTLTGDTLLATIGTNLSAGTYAVNIRAVDNLGSWSGLTTLQLIVSRPAAPTNLAVPSPTNRDPALSWTASPDAAKYYIYRNGVRLSDGTTGTTYTDAGAADGSYDYSVTAVNSFGDESNPSNTVHVLVDKTAPTISYSLTPTPNAAGWNNSTVVVTFTCNDSGSGVVSCTPPVTITNEGFQQPVTGTATDAAGNTASVTALVDLDTTAPSINHTLSQAPNAAGWNNGPVTATFNCTDALSGVASCAAPITETADGVYDLVGTAVDKANNVASDTLELKIDQTAPDITYNVTPAPNANGWNKNDAVVNFTCHDDTSGIASCSAPVTVTSETSGQTVTGTAVDNAGNTRTVVVTIKLDKTAPSLVLTTSPAANNDGWNNTDVTVTAACNDALSGVATCSAPVTLTQEGVQPVSAQATDNAGNSTLSSATIRIDKTAPTISASVAPAPNASGWNKGDTVVTFTCYDALSGIKFCPAPVTVSSETSGQVISGTAVDYAGNSATANVTVKLDKTAPVVTSLAWAANPLMQGQTTTLSVSAADALSGVAAVYYSVEGDAAQPMVYDAASGTWKATLGADLAVNTYDVSAWAVDTAGNVGLPLTDVLAVYNPANGYASGHAWLVPSASDVLPIARDTSAHPAQLVAGFSGSQGITTSVDVHYVIQNNQNEFDVSSTTVDWVVIPDSLHASIMVHGTLTTYVNGVQSTTANVAMRLDVTLGTNGTADLVNIKIWNPWLNPSIATPTYQMSDNDIIGKSQVLIH